MGALSDIKRNGIVSAAFVSTYRNQKTLARPVGRNDDDSEESTMDPSDVYIQEGNNRFMQVEGHPGTVAWKQAIQEATRKFKQSQFRDDHFRHVMKVLAGADRDFYAGSIEYGWIKLNPMQIRAKCKEAYNKQIETDDEISSVFTQISRHHQTHASEDGRKTNQVRLRDKVAYNKMTDKDEATSVYTGMSKMQSKISRLEERNLCEHRSFTKSANSAARYHGPSTQTAISTDERGTEKMKTRGFLARLMNRKSTKDTIASSELPRKSWHAKRQGRLGPENDSRSYKQFHNGNRWVIEPESENVYNTIEEQSIKAVSLVSRPIVYDMGLPSHVTRTTPSPTLSVDIIKDLQEEESRKDGESTKEPENDVRETDNVTTPQSNHMHQQVPNACGGSGMRSVASGPERGTSTTPRKEKHRFSSRVRKGLGLKGVLSRMLTSNNSAQSDSSQVLPQKEESRRHVELKSVQHQAEWQKKIEANSAEVEKDVVELDQATRTEFQLLDELVVTVDTQELDDEPDDKALQVKRDSVDDGATRAADVDIWRVDELPKGLANAQEWMQSRWDKMKMVCLSCDPSRLRLNGCEDIEQAIVEEHGSCYAEEDEPLSMSPFQNEFED